MSTSLPKLQILLNDMLLYAKVKRIQQKRYYVPYSQEKLTISLWDIQDQLKNIWHERNSFIDSSEINKESAIDFLIENSIFYFFIRTIQNNGSSFFKDESLQLKQLIFKSIGFIHSNKLIDEDLSDERKYFDKDKSEVRKAGIEAFYQLMQAEMPKDEFFDYALGFYIAIVSKNARKKYLDCYLTFKPLIAYVGNVQNDENFFHLINEIIIKYFYTFCDLSISDKKFMHTELRSVEQKIFKQIYDACNVLMKWSIKDVYDIVCIDCLIHGKEEIILLEELIAKVFFNNPLITNSLHGCMNQPELANKIVGSGVLPNNSDVDVLHPEILFHKAFYAFADSLDNNPGVVVCLYLLSKEMNFDAFCNFFKNDYNDSDYQMAKYYLKEIDETLELEYRINRRLQDEGKFGKDFRRFYDIFSGYKEAIKKGKGEAIFDFEKRKQKNELGLLNKSNQKKDLLQRFLWFVIFEKLGLLYESYENTYDLFSLRKDVLKPFKNGTQKNEYGKISYVNKMFNDLLKKRGIDNKINLSINDVKDFWGIILLIFNLSRIEPVSKEYLINEINYIREKQLELLHVDIKHSNNNEEEQCENTDIDSYNEQSLNNRQKLKKIDCGFVLRTYAQKIYPLSLFAFRNKGVFCSGFERKITCKLFWETDNVYIQKGTKESLDWLSINKSGLTTRYLYRDRNAYSHHKSYASVNALLKPQRWKQLLLALGEFYLLLIGEIWAQRIGYDDGDGIQKDDFFFQNKFLQLEVEHIYYDLTMLIQKNYEVPPKIFHIFDYEQKRLCIEDFLNYIKDGSSNTNNSFSYNESKDTDDASLLLPRLEYILKIMFLVNDTDSRGHEHSVKFMDFYSQYNTEISIYLIYMAFAMNYCDDVKVD